MNWKNLSRNYWTCALASYMHLKNSSDFNGIRTHDLCDARRVLDKYQLSYEATQLREGSSRSAQVFP